MELVWDQDSYTDVMFIFSNVALLEAKHDIFLLLLLSGIYYKAESAFNTLRNSFVCGSLSPSGGCAGTLHQHANPKKFLLSLKIDSW